MPGYLVVIGGGYIGLELGSVWRRLGAQVTVVEFLDRIVPTMDGEIAKAFERILTRQGIKFRLGMKVTGAGKGNDGVTLSIEPAKGGTAEELKADIVLLSIGRRPYTDGIEAGVELDERGRVKTDAYSPPTSPVSTRSATRSPVRCWRTRRRRKVSHSPNTSPARRDT